MALARPVSGATIADELGVSRRTVQQRHDGWRLQGLAILQPLVDLDFGCTLLCLPRAFRAPKPGQFPAFV